MERFSNLRAPWKTAGYPKETPLLVALSGGSDSVALLHLMTVLSKRDGFTVTAAHLNHGIRGAEALRDEGFCRMLAERYGVDLVVGNADIPTLARASGKSEETVAREERYAFLERVMREREIPLLVTAHHADDNLETVLFRMCRGTGLRGLCGIPELRDFGGGKLVRPLLSFTKAEIGEYCRRNRLEFVNDSTNFEAICSRNRIRLEAIPALEAATAEPQKSVCRMTEQLRQDLDYLEAAAESFYKSHRTPHGLSASALRKAHPAIRRRVLARLFARPVEAVHFAAVEHLLERGVAGGSVALPGGFVAALQREELSVIPDFRELPMNSPMPFGEGILSFCEGDLIVSVRKVEKKQEPKKVHNLSTAPCINLSGISDIMLKRMHWRVGEDGDRILWRGQHRRVRRLCREVGIPSELRRALPLLCDGDRILWIPFVGVSDLLSEALGVGECYRCEVAVPGWTHWET